MPGEQQRPKRGRPRVETACRRCKVVYPSSGIARVCPCPRVLKLSEVQRATLAANAAHRTAAKKPPVVRRPVIGRPRKPTHCHVCNTLCETALGARLCKHVGTPFERAAAKKAAA